MKQQKTPDVLRQLAADVSQINQTVSLLNGLTAGQLTEQPAPGQWSISQCLEHLNTYSRYYLPRIEAAISRAETQAMIATPLFTSSWLGNYVVGMMQPTEAGGIARRYKAARQHQPANDLNPYRAQAEFLQQQLMLLDLLQQAESVNLRRLSIPLSIAGWLSLNLGDVFRFLVVHQQRHMEQIDRIQRYLVSSHSHTSLPG